jgi:hypothetical protein
MARELKTQILIVGASVGGVAAALAACSMGADVILTEPTSWIGGQLTSQAVPPDEHPWIETHGCTRRYRAFRDGIRQYYRDHEPLNNQAKAEEHLNPGGGLVSKLCCTPRIALAVLEGMLQPYQASGKLKVLLHHSPIAADVAGDRVRSVTLRNGADGQQQDVTITADYVLDATELGDLLPLTKTEYVVGAESQAQTNEPHAPSAANPENVQSLTWCFPVGFDPKPGADHTIDKPRDYEQWRNYVPPVNPPWPGKLLSWTYSKPITLKPQHSVLFEEEHVKGHPVTVLWHYRRIVQTAIYSAGNAPPQEVTLVNWPQNDYLEHNIIDKPAADVAVWLEEAKQLSLSLLYWMQTEAPRGDGGVGYRGLCLRPDISGTADGLAMAPYIRESRRIKAVITVTENHIGSTARYGTEAADLPHHPDRHAEVFPDSVGIGYYRIDLHPSTAGRNYIDIASLPFQIPLGALIPQRMTNLLAACKNIGTTHITNGCYRLHPVEWNIGESAGALAAFCLSKGVRPVQVREDAGMLADFQRMLIHLGVELTWPARA